MTGLADENIARRMLDTRRKMEEAVRILRETVIPSGLDVMPVSPKHYVELLEHYLEHEPLFKMLGPKEAS